MAVAWGDCPNVRSQDRPSSDSPKGSSGPPLLGQLPRGCSRDADVLQNLHGSIERRSYEQRPCSLGKRSCRTFPESLRCWPRARLSLPSTDCTAGMVNWWEAPGNAATWRLPGGLAEKAPARTKRNTKLSRGHFRYAPATRARSGACGRTRVPLAVKHPSGSRTLFRSARLASATGNSSHDPRFVRDGVHRSTEPKVTGSSPVGCTLDKG